MKNRNKILFIFICSFMLVLCACKNEKNQAKKIEEVKQSDIQVNITRFEDQLFACDPNKLDVDLPKLEKQFPLFYPVFYNQVLQVPTFGDKGTQLNYMRDFITNKYNTGLLDSVKKTFPNLDFLKKDLEILFTNYKSHFPKKPTPKVITCISEFQSSTFTVTDSIIAISLDLYLGPKYIYYADIFKQYSFMIPTFDKKYMAIDCANVLATNLVPPPGDNSTLLDKMIAKGKMFYIMENLLPNKDENDIIKYTKKDWKFCINNQVNIWTYFINKKLLYDTRFEQYKYITEAPTTYGMPKESPGRVGAWLGWQIVRAYMQQHPNTTLQELLALKDGQKILTESKYKPTAKD
ncbi:MAG: hypothetical protein R2739_02185 [Chitinophagales bacterium]